MNKADTAKLIAIIVIAYPSFDKFRDDEHIRLMTGVWNENFSDDDAGLVALAVKRHISLSKWPPSIADIREIMVEISQPNIIPADEAWEAVSKLLATYGEYNQGDIYKQLPRLIAEAVDAVGYSKLYALYVAHARGHGRAGFDRVMFIQAYEAKVDRVRQRAMLPPWLRKQIDNAAELYEDGSRKLLADLDQKYTEKRQRFEQYEKKRSQIEPPDASALIEERG